MGFLSILGNSLGCSPSGERLVSAARDGDLQEAKALLVPNPRLAKYPTFGGQSSPLHYSAAKGHHEIHKMDYLSGGTALHFAALNGHTCCIRLLLVDYVPSSSDFWNIIWGRLTNEACIALDEVALSKIVNKRADGGITDLHMAALNGHVESVKLLLPLGACVSEVTVQDGTKVDLIGTGSKPLHYAAYGGNAVCCQILIARGANLTAENANGYEFAMSIYKQNRGTTKASLSLSICTMGSGSGWNSTTSMATQLCKPNSTAAPGFLWVPLPFSHSFQKFPSKLNSMLCLEVSETRPCLVRRSRSGLKRSPSFYDGRGRPWLFAFNRDLNNSIDS